MGDTQVLENLHDREKGRLLSSLEVTQTLGPTCSPRTGPVQHVIIDGSTVNP